MLRSRAYCAAFFKVRPKLQNTILNTMFSKIVLIMDLISLGLALYVLIIYLQNRKRDEDIKN